jgi:hypothetical protein
MDTDSPSVSPLIVMDVNSRSNHSFAQRVTFLFFQCQFAVVRDMDILGESLIGYHNPVNIVSRIRNAMALTRVVQRKKIMK